MTKRKPSRRRKPIKRKGGSKQQSPSAMLAQAQKMQAEMAAAQSELENEMVTITAGGGAISITISGHQRIKAIELDPDIVDPEDVEMLQDMLIAGMNAAIEQSQTLSAERMETITGGMGGGGLQDMLSSLGM